jgi:predicted site-specific integrase-resolvase
LDKIFIGSVKEIVVAHRDRLTRFGFEIFEYICKKFNTKITVIEDDNKSPVEDLSEDLFSIITVFTARYNGMRKYEERNSILQKDKDLS